MSSPSPTAAVLARYPVGGHIPADIARAAVLAVLRDRGDEPEVLLIRRTERVGDRASGQIGLPAGGYDPADTGLEETAVRESREEVGLGPEDFATPPRFVRIGWVFASRLPIAIFAAPLSVTARAPRIASPEEIARIFWMPRSVLARVERVPERTEAGVRDVDATVYEGHVVWGFTRNALLDLFALRPGTG